MPEISTPAQDLAALDRVKDLAARYGVAFAGTHVRLRGCIEQEGDRLHALGATLADLIPVLFGIDEDNIGALVARAVAAVGAEIVWPTPDSTEAAESRAGDDTAPGIDIAHEPVRATRAYAVPASRVIGWEYAVDLPAQLLIECDSRGDALDEAFRRNGAAVERPRLSWVRIGASEGEKEQPAREKILAEVAAADGNVTDSKMTASDVVSMAVSLFDVKGDPPRENLVIAASLLVDAAVRLDGAR